MKREVYFKELWFDTGFNCDLSYFHKLASSPDLELTAWYLVDIAKPYNNIQYSNYLSL